MSQPRELAEYMTFGRSEWAALRSNTPLTLADADLATLRGLNEPIALGRGRRTSICRCRAC